MAFTHGSLTFNGLRSPLQGPPPDLDLQIDRFPGVAGESHLYGASHGFELACEYIESGHASEAALAAVLKTFRQHVGTNATLTADSISYANVTFLGFFEQPGARFLDGSGEHGWITSGILRFRVAAVAE